MRRWGYGLVVLLSAVLIAVAWLRMGRSHPTKWSPATAAPHAQHRDEKAASQPPRLFVLAINGGGSVRSNYLSHLQHLRELVDLLHGAGVPWDGVTVLAGDGSDPNPDLIVRMASLGADAWRLRGTAVEEYFPSETILGNSEVSGATLYPATRGSLSIWLMTVGQQMRAGDTLFLYVTDHGALAAEPDGNRIVLWGDNQRLSVRELREALETLDPSVRVVALMSQCYSGGFAKLMSLGGAEGEPTGRFCGFFSTTADRQAYGSYPERIGNPKIGHSFAFLQALPATAGRFPLAHELVVELDEGPDVPVRTSDLYLGAVLAEAARNRRIPVAQVADELLPRAWGQPARFGQHAARLDRLAERFGLPTLRSHADADKAAEFTRKLIGPVKRFAADLGLSIDERNRDQFRRFLAAMPEWRTSLEPKALKAMDADGRRQLGTALVSALGAFARDEGPARATLQKQDALNELAFRMKVREAALARARTLLDTVAGLLYLGDHPAERAALQRLLDCEALDLKLPKPTSVQPNARPPALPPLDDDRARLMALLGAISEHRLNLQPTLREGEPAPELQVIPYRGEIPRIGDGKPVLLFFWSKTCGKCRWVVPELAGAREGAESILAITDDDEPSLDRFFARYPDLPASIARDPGRQTMFRYGVRGQGALVRLDGQGKVVKVIGRSSPDLPAATAE